MVFQKEFLLEEKNRGIHLITQEVILNLPELPQSGILHLFIKHTSAALAINENSDPDVRHDLNKIFDNLIKEQESFYKHTYEGSDDMPAHAKAVLTGESLTIPITNYTLNLGTWQGIYLCEFRNHGGKRKFVVTVLY